MEVGFVYGVTSRSAPGNVSPEDSDYEYFVSKDVVEEDTSYEIDVSGLTDNTTHYYRAFVNFLRLEEHDAELHFSGPAGSTTLGVSFQPRKNIFLQSIILNPNITSGTYQVRKQTGDELLSSGTIVGDKITLSSDLLLEEGETYAIVTQNTGTRYEYSKTGFSSGNPLQTESINITGNYLLENYNLSEDRFDSVLGFEIYDSPGTQYVYGDEVSFTTDEIVISLNNFEVNYK